MTVLFPLTFGGTVFVDASTMPRWVQAFVDHSPVTYLSTAARGLLLIIEPTTRAFCRGTVRSALLSTMGADARSVSRARTCR
jgi:hypothetical protein